VAGWRTEHREPFRAPPTPGPAERRRGDLRPDPRFLDHRRRQIDPEDSRATTVVGTGHPGYNGNKTTHGSLAPGTAVQVSHPAGLSVTRNGDVLFADSGNNLIRAYVPTTGHVIDAMAGVVTDGSPQASFNGDGHFAHETDLGNPTAVAALNGEFIVADTGNHRVRKFGPGPR
jgi:NHL repeat